ncbi:MAG: hypothetical protein WAO20_05395 [Acidobacteriota bacterium]
MRAERGRRLARVSVLAGVLLATALSAAPATRTRLTIEGQVVCVDSEGAPVSCGANSHDFALRTDAGKLYFFSAADPLSHLFRDSRVRERRFRVKVWTRADRFVDIVKIYSIKNGQLYDIYFYCPVCNIRSYEAGDCWCCHQPYELREVPAEQASGD